MREKDVIFMPLNAKIILGVEKFPDGERCVVTRPTHFFVYQKTDESKEYLGFVCLTCCGNDGKWRAEVTPWRGREDDLFSTADFFDDMESAIKYLIAKY